MIEADTSQFKSGKILDISSAAARIAELKKANKTVGLCNGGFDLLHAGHIKHFESAKRMCDCLVVAIASDELVKARKGKNRPIFQEGLRAYSTASLQYVDYVVVNNLEKPGDLIKKLKPSFYIKGPDFIEKTTPGITSEREAIKAAGGEIKYTNDPKLSTTEIIRHIQEKAKSERALLVIDRDGTLIEKVPFLGKEKNWKEQVKLKKDVIDLIIHIQTKYDTTKVVISNQQGVARGYFDTVTVDEINSYIAGLLKGKGITINSWQYCPDADKAYASSMKAKGASFNPAFVKDSTDRKPSPGMLMRALKELHESMGGFETIAVLGDSIDDRKMAENIGAAYIDVNNKSYEQMKREFEKA